MNKMRIANDLTQEQKDDLSYKLELLMMKYGRFEGESKYFAGVADGLNHAYKLVNEIIDDYCIDLLEDGELEKYNA